MIALNALCIPFPGYDSTLCNVFLICVIVIRIDPINMKRCQQDSQFVQVLVFSRTKAIGQRNAGTMIHRPPQPILLRFVMDKGPHLIHFRPFQINLLRRYDDDFFYLMSPDIFLINLPGPAFHFFKIAVTESFAIPNIRPVARVPVQSMASLRTCSLTFVSQALLVYSSIKLRWVHSGLLQRYLCFPALLCPFRLTWSLPQCGHFMVTVFVTIFSDFPLFHILGLVPILSLFLIVFPPVSTPL